MILCLVRHPLDCGGVSGAIQNGNLQFTIYNLKQITWNDMLRLDKETLSKWQHQCADLKQIFDDLPE